MPVGRASSSTCCSDASTSTTSSRSCGPTHARRTRPSRAVRADRHGLVERAARATRSSAGASSPAPSTCSPARRRTASHAARAARRLRRVRAHGGPRGLRAGGRRRPRGARGCRAVRRRPERQVAAAIHAPRDRRAQPPDRPSPARRAGTRRRGRGLAARGRVDPACADRCCGPRRRADGSRRRSAAIGDRAWQAPLRQWAADGDLLGLERELQRGRIEAALALFGAGDPLSIDVPIAFTAAKRSEARNLRLLGEASARGIHADTVRRELLWPRAR